MSNAPEVGAGVWKTNYAMVRKAMIEVVHSVVEYEGKRCNIELLITPLNVLAGVDGNEQYISFNKDLLKTAFQNTTDSIEYFADCEGDLSTAFKGTLHIRIGKGKKGVADIGLFRNKTDARRGMANVSKDKAVFASEHLFRKLPRTFVPSDGLKEGLRDFLRTMKVNRDRATAKAASGRLEKEKKDKKRKSTEISRMMKDDPAEEEEIEAGNSNIINIETVKSSIVERTLELTKNRTTDVNRSVVIGHGKVKCDLSEFLSAASSRSTYAVRTPMYYVVYQHGRVRRPDRVKKNT